MMINSEPQIEMCPSCLPHKANDAAEPNWIRLLIVIVFALAIISVGINLTYNLMWVDEFFTLYTARVASIGDLLHIQASYPVALDPLGYPLLAHLSISLFGANAIAVRLPAAIGFLLMMVCVCVSVRRVYSARAGILAMAMLLTTYSIYYAYAARPYGLLLGFSAAALTAWQSAIRQNNRIIPLMCLAGAVFTCLECHYFALLIPAALLLLECIRTVRYKKFDFPVIFAVLAGSTAILTWLPFLHAAGQFRAHYYTRLSWRILDIVHAIYDAYVLILLKNKSFPQMLIIAIPVVLVAVGMRSTIRDWRDRPNHRLTDEELAFIVFAALPVAGAFLSLLTSGVFEARYTIEAAIGVCAITAGLLRRIIRRNLVFICLITVLVGYSVLQSVHIASANIIHHRLLQTLALPPSISDSRTKIFVGTLSDFLVLAYYVPPNLAKRIWFAEDKVQGVRWAGTDVQDRTAENLQKLTNLQIVSYNSIRSCVEPQIIWANMSSTQDWILQERAAEHFQITTIGDLDSGVLELATPTKETLCQSPVQNQ